jgi:hypothetical protein
LKNKTMLDFISFLARCPRELAGPMEALSDEYKARLAKAFGGDPGQVDAHSSLFHALRELARGLRKQSPHLGDRLLIECPAFLSEAERDLIEVVGLLDGSTRTPENPPVPVLERTREAYFHYLESLASIDRPFQLKEIVTLFKHFRDVPGIVKVSLRTADAVDRHRRALRWYNEGAQEDRRADRDIFNRRYECYEHCFTLVDEAADAARGTGLRELPPALLEADDELFHICLYKHIIRRLGWDFLLGIPTRGWLERFVDNEMPDYRYILDGRNGKYAEAVTRLFELAERQSADSLDKRITWLTNVTILAQGATLEQHKKEAQVRVQLAAIQRELGQRLAVAQTVLMVPQALFDEACQNGFWDLVLKIMGCAQIGGEDHRQLILEVWQNFVEEQLLERECRDRGSAARERARAKRPGPGAFAVCG